MDAASPIVTTLLGAGLPGVVILALAWACLKLYYDAREARDKRVQDAQESAKALTQALAIIERNTEAINQVADMWTSARETVPERRLPPRSRREE